MPPRIGAIWPSGGSALVKHYEVAFETFRKAVLDWKYSPDQPRVPAGNPDGGQWTRVGGGGAADSRSDDLAMARLPRVLRDLNRTNTIRKTEDLLKPGGKPIGDRIGGAGENVRTVTRQEFEALKQELQRDAREVTGPRSYEGRVFERPDGMQFGLRTSPKAGETIEIVKSSNQSLKNGFKVHFR